MVLDRFVSVICQLVLFRGAESPILSPRLFPLFSVFILISEKNIFLSSKSPYLDQDASIFSSLRDRKWIGEVANFPKCQNIALRC